MPTRARSSSWPHGSIKARRPTSGLPAAVSRRSTSSDPPLTRETGMSAVTIYHNPACGTSRNTLGLIRNAGIEPVVIEYLEHPPTREQLAAMIKSAGLAVRDAIRQKGTPYAELGLDDAKLSDEKLLDAMLRHPILIN